MIATGDCAILYAHALDHMPDPRGHFHVDNNAEALDRLIGDFANQHRPRIGDHPAAMATVRSMFNFRRRRLVLFDSLAYHAEACKNRFFIFNAYLDVSAHYFTNYRRVVLTPAQFHQLAPCTAVNNVDCFPLVTTIYQPMPERWSQKIIINYPEIVHLSLLQLNLVPETLYRLLDYFAHRLESLELDINFCFGKTEPELSEKERRARRVLPLINSMITLRALSLSKNDYWGDKLHDSLAGVLSRVTQLHLANFPKRIYQFLLKGTQLNHLSLKGCSLQWPMSPFVQLELLWSNLTHLTLLDFGWPSYNIPLIHGVNVILFTTIASKCPSLEYLNLELHISVIFTSILTPLGHFLQLKTLSLHSSNQLFLDGAASENHLSLVSVSSLSLHVYMKVDNLIYLSLVFPSIEQLYLDASYFYFPRMEEWHLMVGHDEPFANQEKEGWYRQERINLLRELVMALENFTKLN